MQSHIVKTHATEIEASTITGVGVKQFRNMRMRGDGPPWKKVSGQVGRRGGRVVYPISSLEAWIASRPGGGSATA
jgi:hypothetical protein